jgi:hypothetical protein
MSLTGCHKGNKNAFSVDRIDSNKGYIRGNIVLCTFIVNKMKQDLSLNELYYMCDLIQKKLKNIWNSEKSFLSLLGDIAK